MDLRNEVIKRVLALDVEDLKKVIEYLESNKQ